jgi:hypothetical protein
MQVSAIFEDSRDAPPQSFSREEEDAKRRVEATRKDKGTLMIVL